MGISEQWMDLDDCPIHGRTLADYLEDDDMVSDEALDEALIRSEGTNRRLYGRMLDLEAREIHNRRRIVDLETALMELAARLHDRPASPGYERAMDIIEVLRRGELVGNPAGHIDHLTRRGLFAAWQRAVEDYDMGGE